MQPFGRTALIAAVGLVIAAAGPLGAQVSSPAPGPIRAVLHIVNRADVTGIPGKEGIMVTAEWPPGATTGRHTHHGDEYAYVVDGAVQVHADGQPPHIMHAGDSWHMPAGTVHETTNVSGAVAHTMSFFVVDKGKPLSEPAP